MKLNQLIRNILTDTLENDYIGYWADVRNVKRDCEGLIFSFEVKDHDVKDEKWTVIDEKSVMPAVNKIISGQIKLKEEIVEQFLGEEWNYDATSIDCLIQVIIFGEIIYS